MAIKRQEGRESKAALHRLDNEDCGEEEEEEMTDSEGEEEEDFLSLAKDNRHNGSVELLGSMLPSYQPVNRSTTGGRSLSASTFRPASPCFFRPSFLGSTSKSEAQAKKGEDFDVDDEEEDSQFMKLAEKLQRKELPLAPEAEKGPAQNPFQRPSQPTMIKKRKQIEVVPGC